MGGISRKKSEEFGTKTQFAVQLHFFSSLSDSLLNVFIFCSCAIAVFLSSHIFTFHPLSFRMWKFCLCSFNNSFIHLKWFAQQFLLFPLISAYYLRISYHLTFFVRSSFFFFVFFEFVSHGKYSEHIRKRLVKKTWGCVKIYALEKVH